MSLDVGHQTDPVTGARYRHYRGGTYVVQGVVADRDTAIRTVIYNADGSSVRLARRLSVWQEPVHWPDGVDRPRYTVEYLIDEPSIPDRKFGTQVPLVMIAGYAGSGKDSLAEALAEQYGFVIDKTSNPLKHAAWLANNIMAYRPWLVAKFKRIPREIRMRDLIADPFDDRQQRKAKDNFRQGGKEIRRTHQAYGGEVVSESVLGADIWATKLGEAISRGLASGVSYVIPDGRYPFEADVVRRLGGFVVRIDRPGVGPINGHQSETAMDDYEYDLHISNSGTLEDLRTKGLAQLLAMLEISPASSRRPEATGAIVASDDSSIAPPEAVDEEPGDEEDKVFVLES